MFALHTQLPRFKFPAFPKIFSEENVVDVAGLTDGMLLRKVDNSSLKMLIKLI